MLSIFCVILPYIKTETKIEPSALTTEYNGFGKVVHPINMLKILKYRFLLVFTIKVKFMNTKHFALIIILICSISTFISGCQIPTDKKSTNDTILCSFSKNSFPKDTSEKVQEFYLKRGTSESQTRWIVWIKNHTVTKIMIRHQYVRRIVENSETLDTSAIELPKKPIMYEHNFFRINEKQMWKYDIINLTSYVDYDNFHITDTKTMENIILHSQFVKQWNALLSQHRCSKITKVKVLGESVFSPPENYPLPYIVQQIWLEM